MTKKNIQNSMFTLACYCATISMKGFYFGQKQSSLNKGEDLILAEKEKVHKKPGGFCGQREKPAQAEEESTC